MSRLAVRRATAVRAQAEQLDGVPHVREASLLCHLVGPPLHGLAFDLDAATAVPAGQMVMVGVGLAPAVKRLAAGVPDRVDPASLAECLKMPVDRGQADLLAMVA